jgi:plasmid stabilization system protein ParE
MGEAPFHVVISAAAVADLHEIDEYWCGRGEAWRGVKYVDDLSTTAVVELSKPERAAAGRLIRAARLPETRELRVFKNAYRIIYRVSRETRTVIVLRFWHSHRDEPLL